MGYLGYKPADKPLTSADITDSVITSAKIVDGTIALADLSATGTKDSTTFLRGDNTFASAQGKFESALLHVRDEKASGSGGGTLTLGAWRTRTLNTVMTNEISGASLTSNQIILPSGTYYIQASSPSAYVNETKAKLRNITDSTDVLIGQSLYSDNASGVIFTPSMVIGRFTITSQKTFELQHRSAATYGSGFGIASSFSVVEVYADVQIWKVA